MSDIQQTSNEVDQDAPAPDTAPEAAPDTPPDTAPDTASDAASDVSPDAGSERSVPVDATSSDVSDDETGVQGAAAAEATPAEGGPADLEKEGEVAADFLENLLDICDLDGDIDVDIDGDRAAVAIVDSEDGRVPRRLVGENAKVLDALQELTRLAVQSATGHRSRLMLDVAGHRAGRRAELVEVAKDAIAAVRETGEKTALDPMTAFERKVVHDEVLAAGLVSESEGVEPRRHVVVLPA